MNHIISKKKQYFVQKFSKDLEDSMIGASPLQKWCRLILGGWMRCIFSRIFTNVPVDFLKLHAASNTIARVQNLWVPHRGATRTGVVSTVPPHARFFRGCLSRTTSSWRILSKAESSDRNHRIQRFAPSHRDATSTISRGQGGSTPHEHLTVPFDPVADIFKFVNWWGPSTYNRVSVLFFANFDFLYEKSLSLPAYSRFFLRLFFHFSILS